MKKLIMTMAVAIAAAMPLVAETETVGGYTWTYHINGDAAEIYKDDGYGYGTIAISPSPTGAVAIPSTLGGKPVTSIGEAAFYDCSGLTRVTIPNSVTTIGDYAFSCCNGLADLTIPSGVMSIGYSAFSSCEELLNVTIDYGLKNIGGEAFAWCGKLTSVTIPNSVTNIGETAFSCCSGLTRVTIPDSVTSIGACAFEECSGLTSVTIPDSVTSIGDWAFRDCRNLTSVTIPDSVTSIGDGAFDSCLELMSVVIYGDGLKYIGEKAFAGCGKLSEIIIPRSVTGMGDNAFYWIGSEINYNDDIYYLYSREKRKYFGRVTLPKSFDPGDDYWWSGSRSNDDFFSRVFGVRSNGGSYGGYATYNVGNVEVIFDDVLVLPDGNGHGLICKVENGDAEIRGVLQPDTVTSLIIPASVDNYRITSIGSLYDYKNLASVSIPDSVTSIGSFKKCSSLKSITIPSSVKNIQERAFVGCCSLTSIVVPKWCKKVKAYYDTEEGEYYLSDKALNLKSNPDLKLVDFKTYLFDDDDYCCWCDDDDDRISRISAKDNWLKKIKITYKDVKGGTSGGEVAEMWKKAQVVDGAVFRDGKAVGVIQVKVGKASKNGEVAVSGTITGLDGKKLTAKGGKVAVNGEAATATLAVKDGTTTTVAIGKDGISGSWNGAEIKAAEVGGNWTRDGKVLVDAANLPAGTVEELLPDGEPVLARGGKWAFNKAAGVKLSKDKSKAEWDMSNGKTNLSGLKLTYTPKAGTFKGSFKVYALQGADGAKKLKKYTASVTGVVVDGKGYGQASIKKPVAGPWAVTVE